MEAALAAAAAAEEGQAFLVRTGDAPLVGPRGGGTLVVDASSHTQSNPNPALD